jgi:hypothetical protein
MIIQRHILPTLDQLGQIADQGTQPKSLPGNHAAAGWDIKSAQGRRITADIYRQSVNEEKRIAQDFVFWNLPGGTQLRTFHHPRKPLMNYARRRLTTR